MNDPCAEDEFGEGDELLGMCEGGETSPSMRETSERFAEIVRRKLNGCGREVTLSNRNITDKEILFILTEVEQRPDVQLVDLGSNLVGDSGAEDIAYFLQANTTVTSLDLYGNDITNQGASALAAALENTTTLSLLDLRGNRISAPGFAVLNLAMQENPSVRVLHDLSEDPDPSTNNTCECCTVS